MKKTYANNAMNGERMKDRQPSHHHDDLNFEYPIHALNQRNATKIIRNGSFGVCVGTKADSSINENRQARAYAVIWIAFMIIWPATR